MRRVKCEVPIPNRDATHFFEGWFHGWAGLSEHPVAIIELDNGTIATISSSFITFLPIPHVNLELWEPR